MAATSNDIGRGYILGIDMGTTSVKIVVVDVVEVRILYEYSKNVADSYIVHNDESSEQCSKRMITQLDYCVASIPPDLANEIIGIGVSGQMHGVVCWSSTRKPWTLQKDSHSTGISMDLTQPITPYYNWQDNRCDANFLKSLPKPDSHLTIHSGYGCCTLFWLARNRSASLVNVNRSATIGDLVVSILCDLDTPKMCSQNAASWGYFNTETNQWNRETLEANGFPVHLLPEIVSPGTLAGTLKHAWHGIRPGIPVGAALGDLPASVFAALKDDTCAICNISTSAQIVFVAKNFHPSSGEQQKTLAKIVPYFDGQYLYEAAVKNGGNAISMFVKNMHKFVLHFYPLDDDDVLWANLIEEAARTETDLNFTPTFLGERNAPHVRGSVTNVKIDNFSIPQIFRALCRGVITNILNIVSLETLKKKGITKVIATGSALLRNKILQIELEKLCHPFPVDYTRADAPLGAASSVLKTIRTIKENVMF